MQALEKKLNGIQIKLDDDIRFFFFVCPNLDEKARGCGAVRSSSRLLRYKIVNSKFLVCCYFGGGVIFGWLAFHSEAFIHWKQNINERVSWAERKSIEHKWMKQGGREMERERARNNKIFWVKTAMKKNGKESYIFYFEKKKIASGPPKNYVFKKPILKW